MSKADQTKTDDLIAVVLTQSHTHAGVDYNVGDEIQVTPLEKQWLIDNGIVAEQGAQA